jgi:hypothetical protein
MVVRVALTATLNLPVSDSLMLTAITGYRDYESDFFFNTEKTYHTLRDRTM